ncbi:MAG: aldolase/citrate lyase family protein [Acidobacteriota bacterium]|nr:aldolase/citrate lyase family protein [Acidobacteriota bacterium]
MKQTFSAEMLAAVDARLDKTDSAAPSAPAVRRSPVHVVYGGAHLYRAETPRKFGTIALKSAATYAPNFAEFARAMRLAGAKSLPVYDEAVQNLEFQIAEETEKAQAENFAAWFARTIYRRVIEKLEREPVEDFRIDFEDGYGFRRDAEEDADALSASDELAKSLLEKTITPFSGFRIKSFQTETYRRAVRTLDLFLTNLLEKTAGVLPENFVVTLPKITRTEEVEILAALLGEFEQRNNLENGAIKIEIMIETPTAIVSKTGEIALRGLVEAGGGRVNSAHFGAYDYTAAFGISGTHQHLRHEACVFARQMMQIALAPLDIRLSDSVTTEMPVAVFKGENLTHEQKSENVRVVRTAWRRHFDNVNQSLINGFYQSWDLHPAQLPARYAAVYAFFLEAKNSQGARLKGFVEKAAQANLTGNIFDDAASAQGLLNFFARALNCGALTEAEVSAATGLTANEIIRGSFNDILKNRAKE